MLSVPVALLVLHGIAVDGSSACPSPADVLQRLKSLGVTGGDASAHRATLDASNEGLQIRLVDASGATLGERTLAEAAPCGDLAQAAAVLIGTWEASLKAQELSAPTVQVTAPPPAPKPPSHPKRAWPWELAVGLESSYSSAGATFGGRGYWSVTPSESGFGWDVWLAALGSYDIPLSQLGVTDAAESLLTVTWQRFPLGLGGHWRYGEGPVLIDLHGEAELALLRIDSPPGFETPSTVWSADFGPSAGVRVAEPLGPTILWFDLTASWWPLDQRIEVNGAPQTVLLPKFEVLFSIGLGYWRG